MLNSRDNNHTKGTLDARCRHQPERPVCDGHRGGFRAPGSSLRALRDLINEALKDLDGLFRIDLRRRRPRVDSPERLVRALLLKVLYTIRSERQLMEQVRYNLLYRWFVGLTIDEAVWSHSTFSKNRDRLLAHDVVGELFRDGGRDGRARDLLVGGALQRRRHPDSGLGLAQELPSEG